MREPYRDRSSWRQAKPDPESGATIVEVLATLALLSLLSGAIAFAVVTGQNASLKGTEWALWSSRTLQTDRYLRRVVAAVRPPYWLSKVSLSIEGQTVSIPYYGGRAESALVFQLSGDTLTVIEPGQDEWALGPFRAVAIEPLTDEAANVIGLSVALRGVDDERHDTEIKAVFGSRPVFTESAR
jgi:hypothetical protein